jgi:hypothetical protein
MKQQEWIAVLLAVLVGAVYVTGCGDDPATSTLGNESLTNEKTADGGDEPLEQGRGTVPFSIAQIFIENNATAGDAGIQVFFDADGWKRVNILDPDEHVILDITAKRAFRELGITEVRFESEEPTPAEVLALFPAGEYDFSGLTTDGDRLVGTGFLSHSLPAAPSFTPANGEVLDPNQVVINWGRVTGAERYQVIVENDDLEVSLQADVLDPTTSLRVPPTFLEHGREYKVEVLAIAASGNRTITEGTFNTTP